MKLIIGDIHLKKSTISVVDEILDKCRKLATKCNVTIFSGDVNDTKANIRSEALTMLLGKLVDWPTPVIILVGNHDLHNSLHPEDGHSLESLKLLDNVTIVDEPMVIGDSYYIPYYPEDQFKKVELKDADYCFIHQDIEKAKYSSHPNQKPVESLIKSENFSKYKKVFCGHIHLAQDIDNIIIIGTPYTESYKEANDEKHVIVFNSEKDKVMKVPMNVRRHLSFDYEIETMDDVKTIKDDIKSKISDSDLVRLMITTPPEIEHKIKKSLFKDIGIDSVKTKPKNTVASRKLDVNETMTNIEIMEGYLKTIQGFDTIMENILIKNKEILAELK